MKNFMIVFVVILIIIDDGILIRKFITDQMNMDNMKGLTEIFTTNMDNEQAPIV